MKGRGLLLDGSGIGDDQGAAGRDVQEVLVGQRFDQVNPFPLTEDLPCQTHHLGVRGQGADQLDVRVGLDDVPDRVKDLAHRLTDIFPPAHRQNDQPVVCRQLVEQVAMVVWRKGLLDRVNRSVPGNVDLLGRVELLEQVIPSPGRRGEIEVRQVVSQPTVHFVREGHRLVVGPQAGLDVPQRQVLVKGDQAGSQAGRRVPGYQDHVRLAGVHDIV